MPKKILITCNDPNVLELLALSLKIGGFEVRCAIDAPSSMEFIDSNPPDLFLIDLVLPLLDGLKFTHWLRNDKKLQQPILLMTPVDIDALEGCSLEGLRCEILPEPFRMQALLDRVSALLSVSDAKRL